MKGFLITQLITVTFLDIKATQDVITTGLIDREF